MLMTLFTLHWRLELHHFCEREGGGGGGGWTFAKFQL